MGCAASKNKDPFLIIVDKYGEDTVKQFIISVSKVQFIEGNKDPILGALQEKIQAIKNSLNSQIQQTKMEIDKKIQQANPKAMLAAQKTFKVKIEQLMGYKDVIKKYSEYKEQCKLSMQRQQSHTMSHLTNFFKQYAQDERQNIPQMKKYQALDDDQQEAILKAGKIQYKKGVKKGLDEVQNKILDKCTFQNFEPKFQAIVTKQKLNQLINYAQRVFVAGEEKVKGASDCKTC